MTNYTTTAARALLAALDTYREQAARIEYGRVRDASGFTWRVAMADPPPWLPVEVAAMELRRAIADEKPDLFREDESADREFHAPCGSCCKRYGPQAECRPCRHYIN